MFIFTQNPCAMPLTLPFTLQSKHSKHQDGARANKKLELVSCRGQMVEIAQLYSHHASQQRPSVMYSSHYRTLKLQHLIRGHKPGLCGHLLG